MRTKAVTFEEILTDIDLAGRLQGDNMEGGANPITFAPSWAQGVERMIVSAVSNGDALGAEAMVCVIQGSAFPDGPHEIPIGASGGEDVDIIAAGVAGTVLQDLGLRVNGGGEYYVYFQMTGEDGGEAGCVATLIFQDQAVRQPKRWVCREDQGAAVADYPMDDLAGNEASIPTGPSSEIGGIIGAHASDGAALGCGASVIKLSKGVVDDQEILIGAFGGELVTSEGDTQPPTQLVDAQIPCKPGDHIYIELRNVLEDSGTTSAAVSLGLVQP